LKSVWLFLAVALLIMPIFIPSFGNTYNSSNNAISIATLGMFFLTFPSSVIAMPVIFLNLAALDIHPHSIGGGYMALVLLSIVGFLQWFWLMPKLFSGDEPELQRLDLRESIGNPRLFQQRPEHYSDWFDTKGPTPLESVMKDD
jgi:hypothetical protein